MAITQTGLHIVFSMLKSTPAWKKNSNAGVAELTNMSYVRSLQKQMTWDLFCGQFADG